MPFAPADSARSAPARRSISRIPPGTAPIVQPKARLRSSRTNSGVGSAFERRVGFSRGSAFGSAGIHACAPVPICHRAMPALFPGSCSLPAGREAGFQSVLSRGATARPRQDRVHARALSIRRRSKIPFAIQCRCRQHQQKSRPVRGGFSVLVRKGKLRLLRPALLRLPRRFRRVPHSDHNLR